MKAGTPWQKPARAVTVVAIVLIAGSDIYWSGPNKTWV
tara:strand:- start:2362 stop:2475 length:114 start_codon:yes stop_codon:yes gene_type:complete